MRLVVATAVVALCWTGSAVGDPQPVPAGFTVNAALSRAASYVAGKPVTDYCAATDDIFTSSATRLPDWADANQVAAYSTIGGSQSFFRPLICSRLRAWQLGKKVYVPYFAASLLALVHESELLSGVTDESVADCKGLAVMPQVIARFFPLKKRATLHDVMGFAWSAHDSAPEPYLENCPQR